jgi:hypothetical protein
MNTTQAKQQGAAAFKAGKGRAPALNHAFLRAASEAGSLGKLMDAYTHGWTIAMLADGVADQTMPSVRELAAIEAA